MKVFKVIKNLVSDDAANGQKIKVLCRFLWAHIIFLFKERFTFKWVREIKMYAVQHRTSSTECYYYGRYDRSEMRFLEKYLRPGDMFADIGSNIGSYALYAASCGANVIAVEPAPTTYKLLKENISLNPKISDHIDAKQCVLGNQNGLVEFTADLDSTNHVIRENEDTKELATVEVPCMRIDDFLPECNAMKIDVEGYELQVLAGGGVKLLAQDMLDIIIIETFDTYNKVRDYLKPFGFNEYYYDPNDNVLKSSNGKRDNINNAMFIKNVDRVLKRAQVKAKTDQRE